MGSAQQLDDLVGRLRHRDSDRLERLDLALRGPLVAGDDRPGVAHPLALRRCPPGAEGDDPEPRTGGLHDRVGGEGRRDEDSGAIGAGRDDSLRHRVEERHADRLAAALARAYTADQRGAHLLHPLGVEATLAAGDALDDDLAGRVEEDAHRVSATIFCAASQPLSPGSIPFSRRIALPSASLVPESRTTRGSFMARFRRACSTLRSTSSARVIPPKTLIRTPLTFGFMR